MDINTVQQGIEIVTSVIGVAAIFGSFIPQPYSGILLIAKKVLDAIAFNFGQAKNKNAK